jgi:DNA mismatch repair protein MutL
MGRIHRLSDTLINQIAAGEIIERPASVVKELCENSVDAGARTVRVWLGRGGLELIRVGDDGCGMSREDALLSLERHATSKLADAEGLTRISTKGFRGEALPSIASVSRLVLTTSEGGSSCGTRVEVEGGGAPKVADAAPLGGTLIEVIDLFFNTPARRKFLKRESTELGHCEEAVVRLALAHPEVGFFLEHEGRALISSPATAAHQERIGSLLGTEIIPHLLAVDARRLGVTVTGLVASGEMTLPTARGLYTFVNRRYVRDRGVTSAVQRAYQDTLPPGRQPVTVLFIEVDPAAVDVNVHPQKLEVRFVDPRSVQEALAAGIGAALKEAPWREGEQPQTADGAARYALAVDRFLARAEQGAPLVPQVLEGEAMPFGTMHPSVDEALPPGFFSQLRFVGDLARRFWLCEGAGGTLIVVDPKAVHQRLVIDGLKRRLEAGGADAGAPSLFSTAVDLSPAVFEKVRAAIPWFERLGLELDPFGGATVTVRGVPPELEAAALSATDWAELLLALVEASEREAGDVDEGIRRLAAASSPRTWRAMSHAEVHGQLRALDELDLSDPAPRVIIRQLPLLELEARCAS